MFYRDDRGFFLETYNRARYSELPGLEIEFVQDNHSRSKRNVLRGLHLQRRFPQGKLVRVITGHVWDVAVDVDPRSPTYKQWVGVDLTAENFRQLYIPPGYAHGFCVLSDFADLSYKCTQFYHAADEVGLLWCDPELDIEWPIRKPILSKRDVENLTLRDFVAVPNVVLESK
jgi:dTDP-4-dehydrorhamnose 3,5-epimerase